MKETDRWQRQTGGRDRQVAETDRRVSPVELALQVVQELCAVHDVVGEPHAEGVLPGHVVQQRRPVDQSDTTTVTSQPL